MAYDRPMPSLTPYYARRRRIERFFPQGFGETGVVGEYSDRSFGYPVQLGTIPYRYVKLNAFLLTGIPYTARAHCPS